MKRLCDLEVGDRLFEGAGKYISRAGRLVGVMQDPCRPDTLFLLAVQADNRLTIYRGLATGIHLSLARHLPANVFCEFCGIVQAGITIHDTPDEEPAAAGGDSPPNGGNSPPREKAGGSLPSEKMVGGDSPPAETSPPVAASAAAGCLVDFPARRGN